MADNDPYGLGALGAALGQQDQLRTNRQEAERGAVVATEQYDRDVLTATQKAMELNSSVAESFKPVLQVLQENSKIEQEQNENRNGFNILGMIGDELKSITQPEKYTEEGRAQRLQQVKERANLSASMASAGLQVLDSGLKASQAQMTIAQQPANRAKLLELHGAEAIDAQSKALALRTQTIQQNNAVQDALLYNLDSKTIATLSAKAAGKPIEHQGVILQPGALEKAKKDIDDREYAIQTRTLATKANDMELAKLAQIREFNTYTAPQLLDRINERRPDDDMGLLTQAYERRKVFEAETLGLQVAEATRGSVFKDSIEPAARRAEQLKTQALPNSQLEVATREMAALTKQHSILVNETEKAGKEVDAQTQITIVEQLRKAEEKVDKAITLQAKQLGGSNPNLVKIHESYLRTGEVPVDLMNDTIRDSLLKNESLTTILPREDAAAVQRFYHDTYNDLLRQATMSGAMTGMTPDRNMIKSEAAQIAMEKSVLAATSKRASQITDMQYQLPTMPLKAAGITQEDFKRMTQKADEKGLRNFQVELGLSDNQLADYLASKPVKLESGEEIRRGDKTTQILNEKQSIALMHDIDQVRTGLAKEYMEWWRGGADGLREKVAAFRANEATKQGPLAAGYDTMVTRKEQDAITRLGDGYISAYDAWTGESESRYRQYVGFKNEPKYFQATMLQFDKTLIPTEKSKLYSEVLAPLMKEAEQAVGQEDSSMGAAIGLPNLLGGSGDKFARVNAYIEKALPNWNGDPETQKLVKKMLKGRSEIRQQYESIASSPWFSSEREITGTAGIFSPRSTQAAQQANKAQYQWFWELDQ